MSANFRRALPTDADALEQFAEEALRAGDEEQILPSLIAAAERLRSARLWQWAGLLQRSIDEHEAALSSFRTAAVLAPDDAGIAHGFARVSLEAGLDARMHYERALALGPPTSDLLRGRAAARMAAGQGELAAEEIGTILAQMPSWLEGHTEFAQLQALIGRRERAYDSIERALAQHPYESSLWYALLDLNILEDNCSELDRNVRRAASQHIVGIDSYRAIAASELGATAEADELFEALPAEEVEKLGIWRVRHLIRSGRADHAVPIIDRLIASPDASAAWPYAAVVWKLTGDHRADWLNMDGSLIFTLDLAEDLGNLDQLSTLLRSLHIAKSPYFDQSVRGGTQTDGPLLSRIEPEIRSLRAGLLRAIQRYLAELPPQDPTHPLLGQRRDARIRFAGSWSVRLNASGYHESHVHPKGWISSALYLALPPKEDATTAGWLSLGEPPKTLEISMGTSQLIEPRTARLVLFPSWMWHGTLAFPRGERLTVAFDVRPPT